jgi:cold shock CspA family protein
LPKDIQAETKQGALPHSERLRYAKIARRLGATGRAPPVEKPTTRPFYLNTIERGTIKFYNQIYGWGIILDDNPAATQKPDNERDLYFKRTSVQGNVVLDRGTMVRFRRAINSDGRSRCWQVTPDKEGEA